MTDRERAIRREKIAQAYELLREEGIDGWLFLSREGSDPAFSFLFGVQSVHQTAILLRRDGSSRVFCSDSDFGNYVDRTLFTHVTRYGADFWSLFQQALEGLSLASLALNFAENAHLADGLTLGQYFLFLEHCPEALKERIVSAYPLISKLRARKTATEVELIEAAVKTTIEIYDAVFAQIRCGLSEADIGRLFVAEMARRQVENGLGRALDPPIVCIVREGLAHRVPGNGVTRPGDLLVMDFSVRQQGYVSDIARTAYFLRPGEEKAPADVQRAFDTAVAAVSAVLAGIRPGLRGHEVDRLGRDVIEAAGYPTIRHSVGHQIGSECHDGGTVLGPLRTPARPETEARLVQGEVYAIEPTVIQDDGLPSVIVEENGVLTASGIRLFSRRQTELVLFSCGDQP